MKTKIFILMLIIAVNIELTASAEIAYLITQNDTLICKKIKPGTFNICITNIDGVIQNIPNENVSAYFVNGKRFDKMKVVLDGKPTGESRFMELLSQRNGLKLYEYKYSLDTTQQHIVNSRGKAVLLVYKNDEFFLQIDKKNAESLSNFFHLNN
jgi:hypothetical protein